MPTLALAPRLRNARTRLALERDLRAFRREHGAVLAEVPPAGAGTALLASLSHSPFQLKIEGMLAKGLQLAGLDVVAAVPGNAPLPPRWFATFGIERFVALDDFADEGGDAAAEAGRLLARVDSGDALKELEYRGAGVGRQVLSTVSRHLHSGGVDLRDARVRASVREFLTLAVRTTHAAERLLEDVAPDVVLFNERNYAGEGPLSDLALARGHNVVQFVAGFADDALVFKRFTPATKGLHPRSLSEESWERVRALPWSRDRDAEVDDDFRRRYGGETYVARLHRSWTRERTRAEVVAELDLDPHRRTAVVFSHVLWDANMFYGHDLFADQEEWFVETVRAAAANDRVNWVVKLHPANLWKLRRDGHEGELAEHRVIRDRIGRLPAHVKLLEPDAPVSPWALFGVTDVGVTIRGSVGFELPCLGVPVLTAGTGFYSGRGFTVDSQSAREYLERLRTIETVPPLDAQARLLARRHAYALFRLRQTRFTSFRQVYGERPEDATIEVSLRSLDEADDLRRFGEWAARSRALDWLEEPPE